MKLSRLLAVTLSSLLISCYASADVVYENGSLDGTFLGAQISSPQELSDSFSLLKQTRLTSATVGLWSPSGSAPVGLTWSIGSTPFATDVGTGNVLLSNTQAGTSGNFDLYLASFVLNLTLDAGDYWLTLSNGSTTSGQALGWDINFGPSLAYYRNDVDQGQTDSEYFKLEGTDALVPEPASLAIFAAGLIGIAAVRRRANGTP